MMIKNLRFSFFLFFSVFVTATAYTRQDNLKSDGLRFWIVGGAEGIGERQRSRS